jgi:hypothetical protein
VTEVSPQLVVRLLRWSTGAPDGADWVETAKSDRNRVGYLLMSLLSLDGGRLGDRHRRELAAFLRQRDRYAELLADLRRAAQSLYQIKGQHLQALYPAGSVRDSNDLDLVVPRAEDMPAAVGLLISRGFESLLCGAEFTPDGRLAYHVGMRRTAYVCPDRPRPDYVELANYSLVGNHLVPPSFVDLRDVPSPAFGNVLTTLRERLEQPYRVRDLIDAAVSLDRLAPGDLVELNAAIVRLRLAPELADLVRTLGRAGLGPAPDRLPVVPRSEVTRENVRRARRRARQLCTPQVVASRWRGTDRHARRTELLRRLLGSRLFSPEPVEALVRSGLRATGRFAGADTAEEFAVVGTSAVSPAGTFRLSTRRDAALATLTAGAWQRVPRGNR